MATTSTRTPKRVLGIDIGGTGIKAAPVDIASGELVVERVRIDTPQPATPEAVADVVNQLVQHFSWRGPVGATLPAVVRRGVVHSAAHIDHGWLGLDAATLFAEVTRRPTTVLNDADAAAIAEHHSGAASGEAGVISMVTFGTGIGHGLMIDGSLVPNLEFGHLYVRGKDAEKYAAESARERHGWSWKRWALHVNRYLAELEEIVHPDLIVVGGGVANHPEHFEGRLRADAPVRIATLQNRAGIVGAALHAVGIGT